MEKDGTFHDLGIMQDRGRNATVVSPCFFFIKQMTRFVLSAGLVGRWRFSLTNVAETILGRFKVFFFHIIFTTGLSFGTFFVKLI